MNELITSTILFSHPGKTNTDRTLEIAYQAAEEMKIDQIVVATTSGGTGALASERFKFKNLVVVTHSTGFRGKNVQELTDEHKLTIEQNDAVILTCQHAMGGINRAVRRKLDTYMNDEIIAYTLRIFGQGLKVVAEIALMAADAGLINVDKPTICVGGTGHGADTAAVLIPTNAQSFFDLKILHILCMPSPSHPFFDQETA